MEIKQNNEAQNKTIVSAPNSVQNQQIESSSSTDSQFIAWTTDFNKKLLKTEQDIESLQESYDDFNKDFRHTIRNINSLINLQRVLLIGMSLLELGGCLFVIFYFKEKNMLEAIAGILLMGGLSALKLFNIPNDIKELKERIKKLEDR